MFPCYTKCYIILHVYIRYPNYNACIMRNFVDVYSPEDPCMRNDLRKSTTTGMARHGLTGWGGGPSIIRRKPTGTLPEVTSCLKYRLIIYTQTLAPASRFAGLPNRNNKLTPPCICGRRVCTRRVNAHSFPKAAIIDVLTFPWCFEIFNNVCITI